MRRLQGHLLLLGCLFLSACTQLSTQQIPSDLSDTPLPEQWQLLGKLGVRSPAGNGSLSVNWQQDIENYIIVTQAPLGQGSAKLEGNTNRITIFQSDQAPITAFNPEQLIEESFGWRLPIWGLTHWVRGKPQPEAPIENIAFDSTGNLSDLTQSGWKLSLSRYQLVDQWALPGKIRLTQGDTRLTLIIREWIFE